MLTTHTTWAGLTIAQEQLEGEAGRSRAAFLWHHLQKAKTTLRTSRPKCLYIF